MCGFTEPVNEHKIAENKSKHSQEVPRLISDDFGKIWKFWDFPPEISNTPTNPGFIDWPQAAPHLTPLHQIGQPTPETSLESICERKNVQVAIF